MARLFSLAGAVIAGNIIHDYTAVLYVHGHMNNNDLYSWKGKSGFRLKFKIFVLNIYPKSLS